MLDRALFFVFLLGYTGMCVLKQWDFFGASLNDEAPLAGPVWRELLVVVLPAASVFFAFPSLWLVTGLAGAMLAHGVAPLAFQLDHQHSLALHPDAWQLTVALYLTGVLGLLLRARLAFSRALGLLTALLVLSAVTQPWVPRRHQGQASAPCDANDGPWWRLPPGAAVPPATPSAVAFNRSSQYVTMSDGVQLAVDVYLPAGRAGGGRHRVFLHLTRYARRVTVHWPWSLLVGDRSLNTRSNHYVASLLPRDFAVVSVDVRGTGASFGDRPVDLHPREVDDFAEVLRWTRMQPWADGGPVATGGISYDGLAAAKMAASAPAGHVAAVALLFTPVDLYADLCFPGGVSCVGFGRDYRDLTSSVERGLAPPRTATRQLPWLMQFALHWVLGGAAPVDGPDGPAQLARAVAGHSANWDMMSAFDRVSARDDPIMNVSVSARAGDGGPATVTKVALLADNVGIGRDDLRAIARAGTRLITFAGYYDSGSVASAERAHRTVQAAGGHSELVIGPWTHGLRKSCSAHGPGAQFGWFRTCFPMFEYVGQQLDQLLSKAPGTAGAPAAPPSAGAPASAVHYFVMGAEQWVQSPDGDWPPQSALAHYKSWWLTEDRQLAATEPKERREYSRLAVYDHVTPVLSRWNLVQAALRQPVTYARRSAVDDARLTVSYETAPLDGPVRVVGAPVLRLLMRFADGVADGALFVYLEDVAPWGGVAAATQSADGDDDLLAAEQWRRARTIYVTEGVVRVQHQCLQGSERTGALADDSPLMVTAAEEQFCVRSFRREHLAGHPVKKATSVPVLLQPVAYEFARGHRIRIRVLAADDNNFELPAALRRAQRWRFSTGFQAKDQSHGSELLLPTM